MRYQEHLLPVARRVELFIREYEPADGAERTLVLVHGAAEHSERHRHVAERLCAMGWRVLTPDLRGHGRSGGRPMHLSRFTDYVRDLARLYDHFDLRPDTTAQWGNSMGGLVTIRFAQTHHGRFAAMTLASPLLGIAVRIPRVLLASGRVLSYTYPWKRFRTVVNPADVTRSLESLQLRRTDPLYRNTVTAGWFFAVRAAIVDAWREAEAIDTSVLVVQAGDDRVVDGSAAKAWLETVTAPDTRFHELEGQFHELHYEDEWTATVDLIHAWLSPRVGTGQPLIPAAASLARAA